MLRDSRIVRVDISDGAWRTVEGAGIGTSERKLRALYPQVHIEPHPSLGEDEGHYYRVTPADARLKRYELLFETEGSTVRSFRAGLASAMSLIVGCA